MRKDFQTLHPLSAFRSVPSPSEGISLTRLEDRLNPLVPFPHKHDFYQIVLITSGQGWHEIDFQTYKVQRGALFCMRPAEVHTWQMSARTKGLVVEFGRSTLESPDVRFHYLLPLLDQLPALTVLKEEAYQGLAVLLEIALRENQRRDAGFEVYLLSLVMQMLLIVGRATSVPSMKAGENTEMSARFFALLEENFRAQHGVAFYADELGLSPKALAMRFAREGLESPQALIHARCLLEARRLLAYSDLPIAVIGDQLGFEDANYFTRLFRKKVGVTPGEFRAGS